MKTRTYIALSKAGHYTVTVKDLESSCQVSMGHQACLLHARNLVPTLISELKAKVADRARFIDILKD